VRGLTAILMAAGAAASLGGCAPGAAIDKLPAEVGLPAGAPARPAQAYEYPAVHDAPPPRPEPALTYEQQQKVEKELTAARDRQEGRVNENENPAAKAKKPAKKPAKGENTGAKPSP